MALVSAQSNPTSIFKDVNKEALRFAPFQDPLPPDLYLPEDGFDPLGFGNPDPAIQQVDENGTPVFLDNSVAAQNPSESLLVPESPSNFNPKLQALTTSDLT